MLHPVGRIVKTGDKYRKRCTLKNILQSYDNYVFATPTKCTFTIKYMYYYNSCPTCFDAYCAVFKESFVY
jgi:hypothetical protein